MYMNMSYDLCDVFNGFTLDSLSQMSTLKIKHEVSSFSGKNYYIVNYDKTKMTHDLFQTVGLARSIILNSDGKIVCFSPPKSIHIQNFLNKYPELGICGGAGITPSIKNLSDVNCAEIISGECNECTNPCEIIAEEIVEGTMINLFWDGEAWEMATKKSVGANSSFYKGVNGINGITGVNKSFRMMFDEAGLDMSILNKNICYSFVLQHPNHKIVVQYLHPTLTLVQAYSIDSDSKQVRSVYHDACRDLLLSEQNTQVQVPKTYNGSIGGGIGGGRNTTYLSLIETFASEKTPYYVLGIMFLHLKTGERTKVRNPVYEKVKNMSGSNTKLQYQYLSLRKDGRLAEYLKCFPENKSIFLGFRDQLHLYTKTLHENYISCYIKKERPLGDFPPQFRNNMFHLHKLYIDNLREKKQHISKMIVVDYMNALDPSIITNVLNFVLK